MPDLEMVQVGGEEKTGALKKPVKKVQKKAAKKLPSGGPHAKKHGPPHEEHYDKHREKHEHNGDVWRAYQYLARTQVLLTLVTDASAAKGLRNLQAVASSLLVEKSGKVTASAEAARGLEHLCFAAIFSTGRLPVGINRAAVEDRGFSERLDEEIEKQEKHIRKAEERPSDGREAGILLVMAKQALKTGQHLADEKLWHPAWECLRAADALSKAVRELK